MTKILRNIFNSEKFRIALKANKVKKIALFGSYATGHLTRNSDVDFLVDFDKEADLFDQISLKNDLEKILKKKVDVVARGSLNKYIRNRIVKEAVAL